MHKLLERQIRKATKSSDTMSVEQLLAQVDSAYEEADKERRMQDRSNSLMSQEMLALNDSLREKAEEIHAIIESVADGILVIDDTGNILTVNNSGECMLGYSAQELIGKPLFSLFQDLDMKSFVDKNDQTLDPTKIEFSFHKPQEFTAIRSDGLTFAAELMVQPVYRDAQTANRFTCIVHDITLRKEHEARLYAAAFYDKLTGLPNRALFLDRLQELVKKSKRSATFLAALLFIDLDRFKIINDSLGHQAGDELLIEVSKRFQTVSRPYDTVARLGGDEFTIILSEIEEPQHAEHMATRLLEELKRPVTVVGRQVHVSASIGITLINANAEIADDIIRNADLAMYQAKKKGRSQYAMFDQQDRDAAVDAFETESELRKSIEGGDIFVYYQPIVEMRTGKITSFEALIRWHHPQRGVISPAQFIPCAEETGLIQPLGRFVLETACRQIKAWQSLMPKGQALSIAVNLSVKQLADETAIDLLMNILQKAHLPANMLKLEITESAIMSDPDRVLANLTRLKSLGVQLCIDDFGTGYSALEYLHKFPIDILKIDRTFIHQLQGDTKEFRLVSGIASLAHDLGLSVVAEGVETAEELGLLSTLKIDYVQGYYFAKPLNAIEATAIISGGAAFPTHMPTRKKSKAG